MLSATPDHSPDRHQRNQQSNAQNTQYRASLPPRAANYNTFEPITLTELGPPPSLPPDWDKLSSDARFTLIMQTLLKVEHQNTQIRADLAAVTGKVNFHSEVLQRHDGDISRLAAENADTHHAFSDRQPNPEIIISAFPKELQLTSEQFAQGLFAFLGLPAKFNDVYLRSVRFANIKRQNTTTKSLVIRMISRDLCEDILSAASQKRKSVKFTIRNIFGIDEESLIYVNKLQPTYIQHFAYMARQAKKRFGWKSVWTHAGNVCIKKTEQTPVITISLLSQLESISK